MQLTVVSDTPELVKLACSGQLTSVGLAPGSDPMVDVLGPSLNRRVLIDLERTSFMDSAGVSLLIIWQKRFVNGGGKMVLYRIPPMVRQVMDLLRLELVLSLARDEQAAVTLAQGGTK